MSKSKKRSIKKTTASALLFGIILATCTFLVCAFIGAIIANMLDDPSSNIGAISFFVLIISGAITGFSTSRYKGEGGLLPSALAALLFALVCLFLGIIMTGGKLPVVTAVNLLLYVATSIFFSLLAKKHKTKRPKH